MNKRKKQYHYIYKTTNTITGRYYYGMHSTNDLDDGYLGSGKRLRYSIRKYGIECHKKEILEFYKTRQELKIREREIVNLNEISKIDCMNLVLGGEGGGWTPNQQRQNALRSNIKQKWLRENNEEWKKHKSEQLSKSLSKVYESGKRERVYFYDWNGKHHSEETKKRIGQKNSEKQKGIKNSCYGKRWLCNHVLLKNIKADESQIPKLLEDGWVFGRKMSYTPI